MTRFFPQKESVKTLKTCKPQLLNALADVIEHRQWDSTQIKLYQTSKLRSLLIYAFENIPFYRSKYLATGFHPDKFRNMDDIEQIPILSKDELRAAKLDTLYNSKETVENRLLSTSGSTGIPLHIFRSEESLWQFTAANTALYYDWCQQKPIENVLYFIDPTPDGIDFALADQLRSMVMPERIISAFTPVIKQAELIVEFQPEFISAYPSTLRNIAIHFDRKCENFESVKILHVTSESTDNITRRLLARVFPQARIIETYTTTEAGLIGYECLHDGGFHIAEDSTIVEITDESPGRIVVTDLTNFATPIIRYNGLGDLCGWEEKPCGCGSISRRIKHLEGRQVDSITLNDGSTQSPYIITNALESVTGLYSYQFIQHDIGHFEIIAVKDSSNDIISSVIVEQCNDVVIRVLGEKCNLIIRFVDEIIPSPGAHKIPLVISNMRRQQ